MELKFESIEEVNEWFRNELIKLTEKNLEVDECIAEADKLDRQRRIYTRETNRKMHEDIMKNFEAKMAKRHKAFFE